VRAERASPDKQSELFLARLGLQILASLRHFDSHSRFDDANVASRSGLTEAIIAGLLRSRSC